MLKIYFCETTSISVENELLKVSCLKRNEYLQSITDSKRKKQSFFVWKLLEHVLIKNGFSNLQFSEDDGKWKTDCKNLNFSLSHSENIVCVAISDSSVGVDVEKISDKVKRVLLKKQNSFDYSNLDSETFTKIWCEKESEFKRGKSGIFSSFKILDKINNDYVLTVCASEGVDSLERIEFDNNFNINN